MVRHRMPLALHVHVADQAATLQRDQMRSRGRTAVGSVVGTREPAPRPLRSGRSALRPRSRSRTRGRHVRRSASRVGSREPHPSGPLPSMPSSSGSDPSSLSIDSGAETPDETEEIREDLLRRRREPEPRLRERRVVGDDAALRVEAMEGRREVLRRVGQPVRRALLRGRGDQTRGVGERSQQVHARARMTAATDRPPRPVGARSPLPSPCGGSTRSARVRTGRSRRGCPASVARPRRCRSSSDGRWRTAAGGSAPRPSPPRRSARPATRRSRLACSSSPAGRPAGTRRTGT